MLLLIELNPVKFYPPCVSTIATCIFIKLKYLHQFNMTFSHIEVLHKSLPYHRLHDQLNLRQLRRWETDARGPESAILKHKLTWETFSSWETGGETGGIPRHSYQSSPPMSSITNNSQHITRQRLELIRGKYTTLQSTLDEPYFRYLNYCGLLQDTSKEVKSLHCTGTQPSRKK